MVKVKSVKQKLGFLMTLMQQKLLYATQSSMSTDKKDLLEPHLDVMNMYVIAVI